MKPKLMIVDDNPDLLVTLQEVFQLEDFEVTVADNGWNCLKALEQGFQGIIILDLMMPVMDGVETIRNMILDGFIKDNIIVVLTAKKIQGEEFNEIYPYIYDYIQKPFEVEELLKVINKITSETISHKKIPR